MLGIIKKFFGTKIKPAIRSSNEFVLRENDFGTVHVETGLIQRFVERVKVDGVHEMKDVVVEKPIRNDPVKVRLSLVIGQDYSAPTVGANLREAINEELRDHFGIKNALYDIRVTQINQPQEKKKRRVR